MAHLAVHALTRHVRRSESSRSMNDLLRRVDSIASTGAESTNWSESQRHMHVDKMLARRDRQKAKSERMLRRLAQEGEVDAPCEAAVSHPATICKTVFGIGEENGRLPKSRLIHPHSPFHLLWTALTAVFLMYTATVVPAVIAFHWMDGECEEVPTLYFDCVLDTFFLLDILYAFCVGVTYQGHYYDDVRWVAQHYLLGGLLFDLATSIPVSYIELVANAACAAAQIDHGVAGGSVPSQELRFVRALKPLR